MPVAPPPRIAPFCYSLPGWVNFAQAVDAKLPSSRCLGSQPCCSTEEASSAVFMCLLVACGLASRSILASDRLSGFPFGCPWPGVPGPRYCPAYQVETLASSKAHPPQCVPPFLRIRGRWLLCTHDQQLVTCRVHPFLGSSVFSSQLSPCCHGSLGSPQQSVDGSGRGDGPLQVVRHSHYGMVMVVGISNG